jgi:hypothetical protein
LAADQIVLDPVTLVQIVKPGALDGRDVHKSIGPAALRLDKTKSLGGIEPLHSSSVQELNLKSRWRAGRYAAARVSLNVCPGKQRTTQISEAVTPAGNATTGSTRDNVPKRPVQGRVARAPSAQQIAAEIDAALKRDPETRLIGLRSPVRRSWPERIQVGGRHFDVVWCDSGLELRQRIMQLDGVDARAVVLTSLDQTELGNDLVARFARARLSQADSWQMLRTAFQAHAIDSRLSGQDWLPDLLLEHAPPEGYAPLAGGVLDADTAWRHALKAAIGLTVARPDADALLVWTLEDGSLVRFSALHDSVRHAIMARIEEQAGPAGQPGDRSRAQWPRC